MQHNWASGPPTRSPDLGNLYLLPHRLVALFKTPGNNTAQTQKQDRQCIYNATFGHVRITIVAVEKQ